MNSSPNNEAKMGYDFIKVWDKYSRYYNGKKITDTSGTKRLKNILGVQKKDFNVFENQCRQRFLQL